MEYTDWLADNGLQPVQKWGAAGKERYAQAAFGQTHQPGGHRRADKEEARQYAIASRAHVHAQGASWNRMIDSGKIKPAKMAPHELDEHMYNHLFNSPDHPKPSPGAVRHYSKPRNRIAGGLARMGLLHVHGMSDLEM